MVFQNSFSSFETIQNSIEVFKKLPLIKKIFFQLTSKEKYISIKKENNLLLGSKLTKQTICLHALMHLCIHCCTFIIWIGKLNSHFWIVFFGVNLIFVSKSKNQDYLFQEHVHILFISINGPIYFYFSIKHWSISLHLTYSTRAP